MNYKKILTLRTTPTLMKYKSYIYPLLAVALLIEASANPIIVAHRGASNVAPENTMPAFDLAWAQGADAIEGDFHLTADGEVVCIHDRGTKRVATSDLVIKNSTLNELLQLDVGSWRGDEWSGTRIPTASQVFASIPDGKMIYIEIKCGPEIIPKLFDELKQSDLKNKQVVIISFSTRVIAAIESTYPQVKTMWLSNIKKSEDGNVKPTIEEALSALRRIKADGISTKAHEMLDEGYISTIRKAGFEYHVWTIDAASTARRFADMGVLSITTNKPQYIREQLAQKADL